jgi:curved DNA-binding protein CbpA
MGMKKVDYYEFLQISPNADQDTIHRVYRFLAARFHPDNPQSGNADTFSTLTAAYDVLSDPGRRAEYDAACARELQHVIPLSSEIDFMDNLEGETNRRLAVLAVLYYRRRTNPQSPEVALTEIESRMGFPRDYLDFTTWYLLRKNFITRADNSDFTLTAQGVDFVETQRVNIPVLNKLLTSGNQSPADEAAPKPAPEVHVLNASYSSTGSSHNGASSLNGKSHNGASSNGSSSNGSSSNGSSTRASRTAASSDIALAEERRLGPRDRRKGSSSDRRGTAADRRSSH